LKREITLWECSECGWVGYSVDGHCRQFDEHPDGPRIPLVPNEWVRKSDAEALRIRPAGRDSVKLPAVDDL
jgi:hypothetical protein